MNTAQAIGQKSKCQSEHWNMPYLSITPHFPWMPRLMVWLMLQGSSWIMQEGQGSACASIDDNPQLARFGRKMWLCHLTLPLNKSQLRVSHVEVSCKTERGHPLSLQKVSGLLAKVLLVGTVLDISGALHYKDLARLITRKWSVPLLDNHTEGLSFLAMDLHGQWFKDETSPEH